MIPTKSERAMWREIGGGMTSSIGEYTPNEFWELLDAIDHMEAALEEIANCNFEYSLPRVRAVARNALVYDKLTNFDYPNKESHEDRHESGDD